MNQGIDNPTAGNSNFDSIDREISRDSYTVLKYYAGGSVRYRYVAFRSLFDQVSEIYSKGLNSETVERGFVLRLEILSKVMVTLEDLAIFATAALDEH